MFLQWFLYVRPKLLRLAHKSFSEILDTKGGNQFFKFGMGKKRGEPKFFQNLRGEPKPYTLWWLVAVTKSVETSVGTEQFDWHIGAQIQWNPILDVNSVYEKKGNPPIYCPLLKNRSYKLLNVWHFIRFSTSKHLAESAHL